MKMIDGLLAELEQEAANHAPRARADAAGAPVVEAASQIDVARPARAARGDGARQRRRARGDGHDSRAAGVRSARGRDGRGTGARADGERREGEDARSAASTMRGWARRGGCRAAARTSWRCRASHSSARSC